MVTILRTPSCQEVLLLSLRLGFACIRKAILVVLLPPTPLVSHATLSAPIACGSPGYALLARAWLLCPLLGLGFWVCVLVEDWCGLLLHSHLVALLRAHCVRAAL